MSYGRPIVNRELQQPQVKRQAICEQKINEHQPLRFCIVKQSTLCGVFVRFNKLLYIAKTFYGQ